MPAQLTKAKLPWKKHSLCKLMVNINWNSVIMVLSFLLENIELVIGGIKVYHKIY
jgi:hypothetical protein